MSLLLKNLFFLITSGKASHGVLTPLYCSGKSKYSEKVEKNFFQGLPSPAAAAFLASYVLFCEVENFQINIHTELLWCFAVFASLSMVSNIPYFSGKQFNYRKTVPFSVIVLISFGVVFGIQLLETLPEILFLLSSIYVLSGYLFKLRSFFKKSS